jgi:hypothetical protein
MEWAYGVLHKIKERTDNRGLASGTKRANAGGNRTRTRLVTSQILGAMDGIPRKPECRLTAFSAKKVAEWEQLFPLLQAMARAFGDQVPDRYAAQADYAARTESDYIVPGTPFTTVTVNNTYPTGVHTDKGDLDAGFSCLAVARRGNYSGGVLTFPEYRVAVDMQDGDLVLMDAHEWHGNTQIICDCYDHADATPTPLNGPCSVCRAERISVVAYYRTKIAECDALPVEREKARQRTERKLQEA